MSAKGLEQRHPDWGKGEWRNLAVLNAESLDAAEEKIERLTAEHSVMRSALETCGKAINSLPEDALGFGTFTDAMGDAIEYPLRDELSQEIITALAAVSGKQEQNDG